MSLLPESEQETLLPPDGDERKVGTITAAAPMRRAPRRVEHRPPPDDHPIWDRTPHLLVAQPPSELVVAHDLPPFDPRSIRP